MTHKKRRRSVFLVTVALMLLVCLALAAFLYVRIGADVQEQALTSLRQRVFSCAIQCYAIEGAYPARLQYLEENYGLVYNKSHYLISYEAFASNELPSVTVFPR